MSLAKDEKAKIVKKFGKSAKDTGSTATQVALLTKRIEELQSHFKKHNKDNHSKTGLLRIVSDRKKLLTYLKRKDLSTYEKLVKDLKIRN
ncbi:30S ribosomal protein S15 [SAR86 cluster bacterium]|jgi:small subunit ribosomal protein S15|uniref:Small ribosomal subunit protein uS15 n=1 Tax=SAR86 cluster bacterium TaxID=2030880 RepID=A0A9Q8TZ10_9GAMM|nr:30S ribosomal protein S15 [bacterium]MEC7808873.1 30S ribosomal protein S15 [Pseudomonadota bacterium]URQ63426.1 30S ribosomal protein S15 [SAR86 cluster bacterium]URQ64497.1 30S ribosomal protein S15 [SAR86 cluster bacterium]|tara:strand:- start:1592 stop:1861 length:270 start_codon:yes stop_codon:yes gene_type:complete